MAVNFLYLFPGTPGGNSIDTSVTPYVGVTASLWLALTGPDTALWGQEHGS